MLKKNDRKEKSTMNKMVFVGVSLIGLCSMGIKTSQISFVNVFPTPIEFKIYVGLWEGIPSHEKHLDGTIPAATLIESTDGQTLVIPGEYTYNKAGWCMQRIDFTVKDKKLVPDGFPEWQSVHRPSGTGCGDWVVTIGPKTVTME